MNPENEIGARIVNAAFRVHSFLGPGLLESCYEKCLVFEIIKSGMKVQAQVALPLIYREMVMETIYRIDLLVDETVIVEVKAVEKLENVHLAQLLTYLRLSGCKLGYLINFNVSSLKLGIKRVVLGLPE